MPHRSSVKNKVLSLLAEYFCLRTNDLVDLIYGKQTEPNQASMRRTLSILRREGLVSRLPYLDPDALTGGRTYVHGLSDKGVDRMTPELPFLRSSLKTFDEHSQRTLDHELEISLFHIELKKFCEKNRFLLHWQQRDLKKTIVPDALFAITDPTLPEGRDTLYYFLEIERSKIGNVKNGEPSILRKLRRYYEYYGSDACEKDWEDFRQFRVIVVQRNEHRRLHLLEELAASLAHRMFWLTTEHLYKRDLGAEAFKAPSDPSRSYGFFNRS